ncbi:thiopurine S-methyltransferase [Pseudoalteromonas luteoviolacea]|uniref:Thiopurine S-methyltransferase n=1 Tax=Pseudoalteromonas luteoviolacea S4060-1 TaxID=1365257 RepID=A0A162BAK6_9GAMM|nr:thiopurine S-methyltransferase [Pseudoalteromonas luteoviolacea]KZN69203.1 hypothetical protein N478_11260 [Pseudoalteromonas luteoviolacea S4060-1]
MKASFWFEKWQTREIAFHEGKVNKLLEKHIDALNLEVGSHVFVPLCGKTKDIAWLLHKGYKVTGAELSPEAVIELFEELQTEPLVESLDGYDVYKSTNLTVYVGDYFNLTDAHIHNIDAVYDRAAFIAMPASMLGQYSSKLIALSQSAPQLLVGYSYDQKLISGPPFSIDNDTIAEYYKSTYSIEHLDFIDSGEKIKGVAAALEGCWLLRPNKK